MNDVEARQRKLVEKHQKAKIKEEIADDKDDDDDKKPSSTFTPAPAPKILEKAVKEPEFPVQKTSSFFAEPAMTQPKAGSPVALSTSPSHISPSDIVHATLEKIKKEKAAEKEQPKPVASMPSFSAPSFSAPSPTLAASSNNKDSAVQKTLEIIRQTQEAQK